MIKIEISPNRAGDKRIVIWEGINSMTIQGKFANIVWIVRQLDSNGNQINDPDLLQDRRVITPISDTNRVNEQGVLIDRENFNSDEEFEKAFESGFPEFTFWMTAIQKETLPNIIIQAANILNQFGRFDRQ